MRSKSGTDSNEVDAIQEVDVAIAMVQSRKEPLLPRQEQRKLLLLSSWEAWKTCLERGHLIALQWVLEAKLKWAKLLVLHSAQEAKGVQACELVNVSTSDSTCTF